MFRMLSCKSLRRVKVSGRRKSTRAKSSDKQFALEQFDKFYGANLKDWPSIRLGILCPPNYCAFVNIFSDWHKISETLIDLGAFDLRTFYNKKHEECSSKEKVNLSTHLNNRNNNVENNFISEAENDLCVNQYFDNKINAPEAQVFYNEDEHNFVAPTKFKYQNESFQPEDFQEFYKPNEEFSVTVIQGDDPVQLPEGWRVFFFPQGTFRDFPSPKRDPTGLLNYYLMDGSSMLPVLALDVKEQDDVADFCAAPGGKSLAVLFGLKFNKLVCNDSSGSRLYKLKTVLKLYLPNVPSWEDKILISKQNVCSWGQFQKFDKILLDVPCTNDRLSVRRNGNNIFSQARFRERMMLPQLQTQMLCSALKALKPSGSLVYSTCSLSPIQNDGVIHIALSELSSKSPMEFVVKDLAETFHPVKELFKFNNSCKYGQLVLPYLPLNYGPMYISKIQRVK